MADFSRQGTISISCPKLLSGLLEQELRDQGYQPLRIRETGIDIKGSLNDCVALNINLRTAHRVHFLIAEKPVGDPDTLYHWLKAINWEEWIDPDGFFSVTSRIRHPSINNTQFANLKCKDAIVDRIRESSGRRPDTGADLKRAVVFLFWNQQSARIFMDTSGESLSRRGYRLESAMAPMQESLASALLLASDWKPDIHFVNPMCGSGTIAIEAAMMARGFEPGAVRKNYGFMHIPGFDRELYKKVRLHNRLNRVQKPECRIIATDNHAGSVQAARKNAAVAGVEDFIEFIVCDFTDTPIPEGQGVVMLNPPYGERMGQGQDQELEGLYSRIGTFFKHSCAGKTGYVFTGNMDLAKKIGLRASSRMPFYNSTIECRLLKYELYEGKRNG
jgi:23S rRNA G2445 N2-methylase RlmL